MKRNVFEIKSKNSILHRTIVESEACEIGDQKSLFIKFEILGYIAQDPMFSACGGIDFQKMEMYHDGEKWIVEFETMVPTTES